MYVAIYCSFPFPFLDLFGVEITQHHFPCYHGGHCTVLRLQSSVGEWEQWERWQHNTLNTGPAYTQLYKAANSSNSQPPWVHFCTAVYFVHNAQSASGGLSDVTGLDRFYLVWRAIPYFLPTRLGSTVNAVCLASNFSSLLPQCHVNCHLHYVIYVEGWHYTWYSI